MSWAWVRAPGWVRPTPCSQQTRNQPARVISPGCKCLWGQTAEDRQGRGTVCSRAAMWWLCSVLGHTDDGYKTAGEKCSCDLKAWQTTLSNSTPHHSTFFSACVLGWNILLKTHPVSKTSVLLMLKTGQSKAWHIIITINYMIFLYLLTKDYF